MRKAVLDTDTLSAILRQDATALSNAKAYLATHGQLTISLITRYEVLRGLYAKGATSQISSFHAMCQAMEVLDLTDGIIVHAANIYGSLRRAGQLIGDADILIAATCISNGCEIATNNTAHFARIAGLSVCNWLVP